MWPWRLENWLAEIDDLPGEAVAVLREALEGDESLVREHARWALQCAGL